MYSLPKMILLFIASFFLCPVLGDSTSAQSSGLKISHKLDKRIVGGNEIEIEKQPWLASITSNHLYVCIGSILSETIILTAAHCAEYSQKSLIVRVGSSRVHSGGSAHKVACVKRHDKFRNNSSLNDIALLKVSPPLKFGKAVGKIDLTKKNDVINPGTLVSVAGWGLTSERGKFSSTLRSTSLFIVDNKKCAKDYGDSSGKEMSANGLICAAAPATDACGGDSGGPLIINGVQVGITSGGWGCARPEYPGVYVNLAFYRDWIDKNLPKPESLNNITRILDVVSAAATVMESIINRHCHFFIRNSVLNIEYTLKNSFI